MICPGYAQQLFDFSRKHPELTRLALWHTLERPGVLATLPQDTESTVRKLNRLAEATTDRNRARPTRCAPWRFG